MKKKIFITYSHEGKIKKAVLDESLFKQYQLNPDITSIVQYENEMLMERKYAETIGVGGSSKQFLLG
jgi:hypothetical protein